MFKCFFYKTLGTRNLAGGKTYSERDKTKLYLASHRDLVP